MKILYLKDGTAVPILTDHSFADLIEETLGRDAHEYLKDLIEDYEVEIKSLSGIVERIRGGV